MPSDIHRTTSVRGYGQSPNPLGCASQEDIAAMSHSLKYGAPPTQQAVESPQDSVKPASGAAYLRGALSALVHCPRSPLACATNQQTPSVQRSELVGDHSFNHVKSSTGIHESPADASYPVELAANIPLPGDLDDGWSG